MGRLLRCWIWPLAPDAFLLVRARGWIAIPPPSGVHKQGRDGSPSRPSLPWAAREVRSRGCACVCMGVGGRPPSFRLASQHAPPRLSCCAPPWGVRDSSESHPYLDLRTACGGLFMHPRRRTAGRKLRKQKRTGIAACPSEFVWCVAGYTAAPLVAGSCWCDWSRSFIAARRLNFTRPFSSTPMHLTGMMSPVLTTSSVRLTRKSASSLM